MTDGNRFPPSRALVPLLIVAAVAAFLNFASFIVISSRLGGDALNGKVEKGRYYVGNHGRFTEVSAETFAYSRRHATSLFVTHPLGMCAMLGLFVVLRRHPFWASLRGH